MDDFKEIFERNKAWIEEVTSLSPDFFTKDAQTQSPEYLWIGCSDSRVSATQVTDLPPGKVFVHRNIANLVIHTDVNVLSVVYYAVTVLKVKHVIVCGHYNCGGIKAALDNKSYGFLDNWLRHIKDVYDKHYVELDALKNEKELQQRFTELNITEQVLNLAKVSFIQSEWENSEYPYLHGVVYDVNTGNLKDLYSTINSIESMNKIFHLT